MPAPEPRAPWWRQIARWLAGAMVMVLGALLVVTVFPWCGLVSRRRWRQRWSRLLLAALGVRRQVAFHPMPPGVLLVANHISWLDVFVINAEYPAAFVSKDDVRAWPLIGWLAAHNETLFLNRGSRAAAAAANHRIAAQLAAGGTVAVFPEGQTSHGDGVAAFYAALLQPAVEAGHPVVPLALAYVDGAGQRSFAPAYVGDDSLFDSLRRIVAAPVLTARLQVCPSLDSRHIHRRELASQAREAILASLATIPGTTAR